MSLNSGAVVSFLSAIEATYGTQPTTGWRTHQPNSSGIKAFYAKLKKVAREPLSPSLQREKGDVVDSDFAPQLIHDLNKEWGDYFLPGILLATEQFNGGTGTGRFAVTTKCTGEAALTAVTTSQYTVASGGALPQNVLVYARGFANAANNGLLVVQASSTATAIKVTGTVAEASPPANATVEVCGVQGASADITCTATQILSTALDFTTLGLKQYQWMWVGGGTAAAPGNFGFATAACRGFVRITAIAAHAITFDRSTSTFTTDAGTGKTIQLFFGSWLSNTYKTDANHVLTSYSAEVAVPGLGAAGVTAYCYGNGLVPSKLEIDAPKANKIVTTMTFMGKTFQTWTTSRGSGPSSAAVPLAEALYNTTSHIPRLYVNDGSGNVVCQDLDTWKLTVDPMITGQKQQGTLGVARAFEGQMGVSFDLSAFLIQTDLIAAISNNTSLQAAVALRNNDGGMLFDTPLVTGEDGEPDFPLNAPNTLKSTLQAYRDPTANFELAITRFPSLPAT